MLKAGLPLTLVAAVAVLARTWQLSQNDFGRQYYAAGVRSMLDSWHNFLFNAFDPAGFVSIDKPPVAIWLQVASAKLLGFSALSILLAQVIAGLAAITVVYVLVQKYWGRTAASVAALSLALSPVNVAVDRSNNTESCLILVLLAGAWLGMRAAETGRLATLCAAMAAIGIGFNVKMGAALVLAPVLALTFSLARPGAPVTWHLGRQTIAGIVLVAVALSWAIFFDLTPVRDRPYAGSTRHNSMLELALVHNGAARFVAMSTPAANPAISSPSGEKVPATTEVRQPVMTDDSPTGPLRLFRPRAAAQFAWLLPLALVGLILAWADAGSPGTPASRRISAGVWTCIRWREQGGHVGSRPPEAHQLPDLQSRGRKLSRRGSQRQRRRAAHYLDRPSHHGDRRLSRRRSDPDAFGRRTAGLGQAAALRDAGRIYPGACQAGGGAGSDRAMGARPRPSRRSKTVAPVRFEHPLPHQPRQ